MLDATCAPADIAYPTDLSLLNEAREKLEDIIDTLHAPFRGKRRKPRTYREKARRDYLKVAKQKRPGACKVRKAIDKQQLHYIKRNLKHIAKLADESDLRLLDKQQYKRLLVIQEVYRQQKEMYDKRSRRIDNRIVSITQPHVCPIVCGKARAHVEFGVKVAVSVVDGDVIGMLSMKETPCSNRWRPTTSDMAVTLRSSSPIKSIALARTFGIARNETFG